MKRLIREDDAALLASEFGRKPSARKKTAVYVCRHRYEDVA